MILGNLLPDFQLGKHNAILYPCSSAFDQLVIEYCRMSLNSSNGILLILTQYDSIENILKALEDIDADITSRQKEGSFAIRESRKAYFNLADELVDIMIMVRMLLQRKRKLGKDCLTVICDMRVFFYKKRIIDLLLHETKLLSGSVDDDEAKIICCYEKSNLAFLSRQQKQQILSIHHNVLEL